MNLPPHPLKLIPELCQEMYRKGWATGTGGGFSMKYGEEIWIAPSGVQKEYIQPQDLFVLDTAGGIIERPQNPTLNVSECTPLFFNAYTKRQAGAVLHSHSQNAVLVTFIYDKVFTITGLEMIKGIKKGYGPNARALKNTETLVVPIIENTEREYELTRRMAEAMDSYPDTSAVLVR
eukprot:TRINITY_DN5553_c0_g1_i3.p1 TRINITY_DN5553_c0_g1~~TRINITY_DN5553_c0_g1_i3.p1  ORF type:complete len:177 (-),score=19.51 TRINITY_DN5553_c0_g1_i3:291-821(-)